MTGNAAFTENPLYKFMLQTAGLTVWEYDIDSKCIRFIDDYSSRHISELLGLPPVIEDVPHSLLPYVESRSEHDLLELYKQLEKGAETTAADIWFFEPVGRQDHCSRITYVTIFDEHHIPVKILGIGQNITAQKTAEEKYVQTFQQLAETHPLSLGSFHLNLTKNWCGDGKSPFPFVLKQQEKGTVDDYFLQFSKLIADETVRHRFFEIFDREKLIKDFHNGTASVSIEYPFEGRDDKEIYWRSGILYMIENPSTHDIEGVTYAVDINEKKKLELATEAAMTDLCDYIALINPKNNTTEFLTFKHYSKTEEFLHRKTPYEQDDSYFIDHFIVPEEKESFREKTKLANLTSILAKEASYIITFRQISEDGKETRKQLRYCWLDRFRREIVVVQSDITEAYNLEQTRLHDLQQALDTANKADIAKTEFISRISHDIRTPIGAISNMTEFAFQDIDQKEKLKNDLEKIRTSNTFLLSLINDVLDISKIDSGKIEFHPEPYPFPEYIGNIQQMFEPLCRQKGLHLILSSTAECGIVIADKIRLNQIVFNIMSNAVKYTPSGGTVSYRSESRNIDNHTLMYGYTVRDTGIGMSNEYLANIFQPFTQDYMNPNRSKAETGTGLGLSIVKRLLDLMGGTISVSSELGKGTEVTVRITLPMISEKDYQTAYAAKQNITKDQRKKLSGTILLAEDNEINREIAVRILNEFGLAVVCAENGEQAVRIFQEAEPDSFRTILMDLQMPILNGYEAAEKIRNMNRSDSSSIPIFALTADAFTEAAARCTKAGMNGQILKPIDPAQLYETLQKTSG